MVTQSLKYGMQMFSVLGFILGINQNIINENDHEFVQLWLNTEFIRYIE